LVYEVGQVKEANVVPRVCDICKIVRVSGATEQDVERFCVRRCLRPLDFFCCSFEIGENALAYG
jgi:hypothetical protein